MHGAGRYAIEQSNAWISDISVCSNRRFERNCFPYIALPSYYASSWDDNTNSTSKRPILLLVVASIR
jgi:hypothetical protein